MMRALGRTVNYASPLARQRYMNASNSHRRQALGPHALGTEEERALAAPLMGSAPHDMWSATPSRSIEEDLDQSPNVSIAALKSRIRAEILNATQNSGPRLMTIPGLSAIIKGLRPGELSIFTGPTGSGKTTVLAQLSLDYCFQGIKTLWGSFEIRPARLAHLMMQQYAAAPFGPDDVDEGADANAHGQPNQFDIWADRMEQLPMYFMRYFGSTSLENVLHAMENGVSRLGIQHIILDNLQFMLSGQHENSLDKFELLDRSIAALRSFANQHNVHVTLVIHPRKEMDDVPLGLVSISGTAKATQEADNVIILQKIGKRRYLDVKKNRWDGELGSIEVFYHPESRMLDQNDPESGNSINHNPPASRS